MPQGLVYLLPLALDTFATVDESQATLVAVPIDFARRLEEALRTYGHLMENFPELKRLYQDAVKLHLVGENGDQS